MRKVASSRPRETRQFTLTGREPDRRSRQRRSGLPRTRPRRQRSAFNGHCAALIRAGNTPGTLTLTATAPGLSPATEEVQVAGIGPNAPERGGKSMK